MLGRGIPARLGGSAVSPLFIGRDAQATSRPREPLLPTELLIYRLLFDAD